MNSKYPYFRYYEFTFLLFKFIQNCFHYIFNMLQFQIIQHIETSIVLFHLRTLEQQVPCIQVEIYFVHQCMFIEKLFKYIAFPQFLYFRVLNILIKVDPNNIHIQISSIQTLYSLTTFIVLVLP